MQPNTPITPPNDSPKKLPALKMIIAITALILFGSGYCFSQSNKTGGAMKTKKTKNVAPVYLDKNNPIYISIKGRAVTDLKQSLKRQAPESPETKLMETQMEAMSQEKQSQIQDQYMPLLKKSIEDYVTQTHLLYPNTQQNVDAVGFASFMLVVSDFGKEDEKKIAEEHDIRVQYLGSDKYAGEFWQDDLAVYSDKNVPDHADPERKAVVKERYAIVRKSIKAGKQERYTKVMALLYTLEKDGSITFHDPFQPIFDFFNRVLKNPH